MEHYRDGQCSDSNPSFTLYLDWTLYIFLYFIISSPPLIPGRLEQWKCRTNSVQVSLTTLVTEMDFTKTFENYGHVGPLVKHCELKITFDAHLISRLNASSWQKIIN